MKKLSLCLNIFSIVISVSIAACNGGGSSNNTSVSYSQFNCFNSNLVSFPGISGIRQVDGSTDVYVTGVYVRYGSNHGFVYNGPITGGGNCYAYNYPDGPGRTVTSTSPYGPNNNGFGKVNVVGAYTIAESNQAEQLGFLYQGANDGSTVDGWTTLYPESLEAAGTLITNVQAHSTMGKLVVGDYNIAGDATGKAFIYDMESQSYTSLMIPGAFSTTAYGIWYNEGTSYTIAGGYSVVSNNGLNIGFVVDYDSKTHQLSNLITLNYNNLPESQVGTHFEGITTDNEGGYNLVADWNFLGDQTTPAFVHLPRNQTTGSYESAVWTNYWYPGSTWTSANTVYENYALGLYQIGSIDYGYVTTFYNK